MSVVLVSPNKHMTKQFLNLTLTKALAFLSKINCDINLNTNMNVVISLFRIYLSADEDDNF